MQPESHNHQSVSAMQDFVADCGMGGAVSDLPSDADEQRIMGRLIEIPQNPPTTEQFLLTFQAAEMVGLKSKIIDHVAALAVDEKYSYAFIAEEALYRIGHPMAVMLRKRRTEAAIEERRRAISNQPIIRGCCGDH